MHGVGRHKQRLIRKLPRPAREEFEAMKKESNSLIKEVLATGRAL
ncbi:MAG: hypothetical protein QGI79_07655 [Dehalococcoidia bacterium]|jgi:hypothetical protein|nr:hypothetical protein [Dehalococcoidia bacterium]